ncbi:MAG: hypothetical protein JSS00_13030 [Proteobacteria bacterium]|nr:hypothetical protein [Pseudomonadota bacterium]
MRHSTLTGSWSGAYRYPNGGHETVFNTQIEEAGGAFVGATQEPNEFLDAADTVLYGEIEGHRDGCSVSFTKFYNHGHVRHSIRYEGVADPNLSRIEGRWIVSPEWSGTYFMARDEDGDAVAAEESAEAMIVERR